MSNKLKIILAIITSVLIISGSAIIFNSQRRNSQTQIAKVDSSISSLTVSSNSSSQVSSVSVSSVSVESSSSTSSEIIKIDIPVTSQVAVSQTPVVEKPKSAVPVQPIVNPVVVPKVDTSTKTCNLPQSPNLVRTDNGCFELFFDFSDGSVFKNPSYSEIVNSNLLFDNTLNRGILTNIAKDYYTRISGQIISNNHKLFFTSSKKVNNSFQVSISVSDEDFFKNTNVVRIYSVRLDATYNFYKTENGAWTYSFKQFN